MMMKLSDMGFSILDYWQLLESVDNKDTHTITSIVYKNEDIITNYIMSEVRWFNLYYNRDTSDEYEVGFDLSRIIDDIANKEIL